MKCDKCGKEIKTLFDYKEQPFNDKVVPAARLCSVQCLDKHIQESIAGEIFNSN